MTPKKTPGNALQAVLNQRITAEPPAAAVAAPATPESREQGREGKKTSQPSREGTRMIAGHFPPAVSKQLKIIAAEEDSSVQELLGEALNLLFIKKGKTRINLP
jgi:hypothetical protein